jgi:hypothetical protein
MGLSFRRPSLSPSPSPLRGATSPPLREGEDGSQARRLSSPPGTGGEVAPRSGDGEGGNHRHHVFFAFAPPFFFGFSAFAFSAAFDTLALAAFPSRFT